MAGQAGCWFYQPGKVELVCAHAWQKEPVLWCCSTCQHSCLRNPSGWIHVWSVPMTLHTLQKALARTPPPPIHQHVHQGTPTLLAIVCTIPPTCPKPPPPAPLPTLSLPLLRPNPHGCSLRVGETQLQYQSDLKVVAFAGAAAVESEQGSEV